MKNVHRKSTSDDELYLFGMRSDDEKIIRQMIVEFLPRLIESFRNRGAVKEDVEDMFSDVFYSVKEFVTKDSTILKGSMYNAFYRRMLWLWLDKLKITKKEKNLITSMENELLTYEEIENIELLMQIRSIAFWECLEKLGETGRKILYDLLKNNEISNSKRAKSIGLEEVYYRVAKTRSFETMRKCLENNPYWGKQFD